MKALLLTVALLVLVGCQPKTEQPPVAQPPVVQPPVVEPPAEQEYCKAEGKQFSCMSALYFYGKECPAQGPVYVKDLEEMLMLVEKSGQAVDIKMKDGSIQHIGVGFAMPCEEL